MIHLTCFSNSLSEVSPFSTLSGIMKFANLVHVRFYCKNWNHFICVWHTFILKTYIWQGSLSSLQTYAGVCRFCARIGQVRRAFFVKWSVAKYAQPINETRNSAHSVVIIICFIFKLVSLSLNSFWRFSEHITEYTKYGKFSNNMKWCTNHVNSNQIDNEKKQNFQICEAWSRHANSQQISLNRNTY